MPLVNIPAHELRQYTRDELVAIAQKRKLPTSGTKAKLVARIEAWVPKPASPKKIGRPRKASPKASPKTGSKAKRRTRPHSSLNLPTTPLLKSTSPKRKSPKRKSSKSLSKSEIERIRALAPPPPVVVQSFPLLVSGSPKKSSPKRSPKVPKVPKVPKKSKVSKASVHTAADNHKILNKTLYNLIREHKKTAHTLIKWYHPTNLPKAIRLAEEHGDVKLAEKLRNM